MRPKWVFDLMNRYLYIGTHEAIISDELFQAVQQTWQERSKSPQNKFAINLSLWEDREKSLREAAVAKLIKTLSKIVQSGESVLLS